MSGTRKGKTWDQKKYTALEIARKYEEMQVEMLLERFLENPLKTQYELRVKLTVLDEMAAEVFALTVFLCDNLLQLKPAPLAASTTSTTAAAATRFFMITSKLPMELQMVLCHRVVGSMKQSILHKDSEKAFKSLVRILLIMASTHTFTSSSSSSSSTTTTTTPRTTSFAIGIREGCIIWLTT